MITHRYLTTRGGKYMNEFIKKGSFMKKFGLIFTLFILVLLTSCDVFYSSLSGSIYDADSRDTPLSGVQVYGYTDENERNNAFSSYEKSGGVFRDSSCLFRATTNSQGSWTISKIVWDTGNGKWGKDFDHKTVYLIYFSEPYGCWKSDAIEVISSANNTVTTEYRRKVMKDSTLTLSFKDKNGSLITDDINFTYEFNNGYDDIKKNSSTSNGSVILSLSYLIDDTKIKISNITIPDGTFNNPDDTEVTLDASSIKKDISLSRIKYILKNGFSGNITGIKDQSGNYPNMDNLTLELRKDTLVLDTITSNDVEDSDGNPILNQKHYETLGSGKEINYDENGTKVIIRLYKNKQSGSSYVKDDNSYVDFEVDLNTNNTRNVSFTI